MQTSLWLAVLVALSHAALSGCSSCKHHDAAAVDAGVDVAPAAVAPPNDAAAPLASAAPAPPDTTDCTLTLKVGALTSSGGASGITDPDLRTGSTSTLSFPCSGGAARAQFGKHSFTGTADPTHVHLTATSTYAAFGCPWQTMQTISGAPPALRYSYTEHIVGTCKSSAHPSTMSAPVAAR
jgi:hypothetical protein